MEKNTKKILGIVISLATVICKLSDFYNEHIDEIREIIKPFVKSCHETKDIQQIA